MAKGNGEGRLSRVVTWVFVGVCCCLVGLGGWLSWLCWTVGSTVQGAVILACCVVVLLCAVGLVRDMVSGPKPGDGKAPDLGPELAAVEGRVRVAGSKGSEGRLACFRDGVVVARPGERDAWDTWATVGMRREGAMKVSMGSKVFGAVELTTIDGPALDMVCRVIEERCGH